MLPELLAFQRGFAEAIGRPASGPLAVYRNTVIHGAVEALRANFPVAEQIVGPEMFAAIAAEFAAACPPRSPVLALYGERFAGWLQAQPWIGDVPYLPDVARVERLHIESLFASDAEPLRLDSVPRDRGPLTVRLHPAARFNWLPNPAMSLWLAHQVAIESELELDWLAEGALFTRPSPRGPVHGVPLDRAAHRFLFGLRLGESVGASARVTLSLYPQSDPDDLFASFLNLGAFAAPASERPNR